MILEELKEWKKAASNALAFYTKNPGCELNALPFENDKACNSKIKDLSWAAKEVKKLLSATTKKGAVRWCLIGFAFMGSSVAMNDWL